MSHEVYEYDKVVTVGDRAWHFLDENKECTDLDEVQTEVHNYEVAMTPMVYENPSYQEDSMALVEQDEKYLETNKAVTYRLVENGQKHIKLGEVSSNYEILQPTEFIDIIRPIEQTGLVTIETAGTIYNGAVQWVLFLLGQIEPVPGDVYKMYLAAFNSFNGSIPACFLKTSTRVVCNNTVREALANSSNFFSARHTRNVKVNFEAAREAIIQANEDSFMTELKLKKMSQIVVSEEQIMKVVRACYAQKIVESDANRKPRVFDEVLNLFYNGKGQDIAGVEGTGLALFNAITERENHYAGSDRKNPSNADSRLHSVLFGNSAKIQFKAMQSILALADNKEIQEVFPASETEESEEQ